VTIRRTFGVMGGYPMHCGHISSHCSRHGSRTRAGATGRVSMSAGPWMPSALSSAPGAPGTCCRTPASVPVVLRIVASQSGRSPASSFGLRLYHRQTIWPMGIGSKYPECPSPLSATRQRKHDLSQYFCPGHQIGRGRGLGFVVTDPAPARHKQHAAGTKVGHVLGVMRRARTHLHMH
jgi:hypothetical protein